MTQKIIDVGIAKSTSPKKRRAQLQNLTSIVKILPFGAKEARESAAVWANLENQGNPIGPYDTLIAGTALVNARTLVIHHIREFSRIEGLKLEDWCI